MLRALPYANELLVTSDSRGRMSADLPSSLYHYTDIHALKGIWESGEFWATESFYLNDTSELTVGFESIGVAILKRRSAVHDKFLADAKSDMDNFDEALNELKIGLEPFNDVARLLNEVVEFPLSFVVSLSENADQLSQWRAYAKAGYCLEFSTEALYASLSGHRELRRVSYQQDDKGQLADSIVDKVAGLRAVLKQDDLWDADNDDENRDRVRDFYAQTVIATEAAFFKDKNFSEEAEVRLVETNVGPDFHWASQYGMTPRKRFAIPSEALTSVTVGPGPHMEQRVRSLRSYFAGVRYKNDDSWSGKRPQVLKSTIPFRDW